MPSIQLHWMLWEVDSSLLSWRLVLFFLPCCSCKSIFVVLYPDALLHRYCVHFDIWIEKLLRVNKIQAQGHIKWVRFCRFQLRIFDFFHLLLSFMQWFQIEIKVTFITLYYFGVHNFKCKKNDLISGVPRVILLIQ